MDPFWIMHINISCASKLQNRSPGESTSDRSGSKPLICDGALDMFSLGVVLFAMLSGSLTN